MNSVFKHREDKSDETLSRLADSWNGKKSKNVFQRRSQSSNCANGAICIALNQGPNRPSGGEIDQLAGQFDNNLKELNANSNSIESDIHMSQNVTPLRIKPLPVFLKNGPARMALS